MKPSKNTSAVNPFFDDPMLGMSLPGRLLVRVVGAVTYVVFVAATFTFLFSDVAWLKWLGVFFLLVLLDRLMHAREADAPLHEAPKAGRLNIHRYMRPYALKTIERAYDRSVVRKTDFLLECAKELLKQKKLREALARLDVDPREFEDKLENLLKEGRGDADDPRASAQELALRAFWRAIVNGGRFVGAIDLFGAIPDAGDLRAKRLFNTFGIEQGDLEGSLIFARASGGLLSRLPRTLGGFMAERERRIRHRVMNRAWTSRATPMLDKFSVDFTDLARSERIGLLVGHEKEFARLVDVLARPVNPNALLVGDPGIGKETLITHLAYEIEKDRVPKALFDRRVVSLELPRLVAGATPDELHLRLAKIVEEIKFSGNIVLVIPDIHNLVRTSGTAYLSAADALMPVVMSNVFPVVGTTYYRDYKTLIEPRSDFGGAFEVVPVEELSIADAERLLVYEAIMLERQSRHTITFGAIKMAVKIAKKYFHQKPLPGSAEELLKGAVVLADRDEEPIVTPALVVRAAEERVNIPIHEATAEERATLLGLEDKIHKRLIDQEEAVKAVANSLREYRSGLLRDKGPIASFLFVGPTGVGKTELAKALAEVQFGSEEFMVRFDMTEYQDRQSIYRFIGSPDGTIHGALTSKIMEKPYALILLDEFEKANSEIVNLFLQVMDDGRLTDGTGRTIDFSNTIIIATSNAHSDIINDALRQGQSMASIADYLKKRLVDVFKPELLNRFSRIVVFRNLEFSHVMEIARLQIQKVQEKLAERNIDLRIGEGAVKKIAQLGYDPEYGARPLKRAIEEYIQAPLAQYILREQIKNGDTIVLGLSGDANEGDVLTFGRGEAKRKRK